MVLTRCWYRYNAIIRSEEKEAQYWAELRNTNLDGDRRLSAPHLDGEGATEGAEETKGSERNSRQVPRGRGRGRGRGGAVGRGEGGGEENKAEAPQELSALQRRRKDQNKAKVGNHNRKAAAAKKQSKAFGLPGGQP